MTFDDFARKKVSLSALIFGVTLIILLSHLLQLLPGQLYFTFSGFVFGANNIDYADLAATERQEEEHQPETTVEKSETQEEQQDQQRKKDTSFLSVVFKMAIPAIAGLLLGFMWEEDGVDVASAAGFGGAFVLAWPAIILWEFVVIPEVVLKRNAFLVLYLLYALSYSYLCRFFSYAGLRLRARYSTSAQISITNLDWKTIISSLVGSVISGALTLLWPVLYVSPH
jgi:hypothetical protein